jgi:hypothetical protein
MGKKKPEKNQPSQVKYADPREAYLSTKKEMVVVENTGLKLSGIFSNSYLNDSAVIAEDQKGFYVTGKSYVGSSVLDPYRSYEETRKQVNVIKTETGFDIEIPAKNMMLSVTT